MFAPNRGIYIGSGRHFFSVVLTGSLNISYGLPQWGRRIEERPNTEAHLAGWRKMTQPGEICLMLDASQDVLYRLAEPRAAKPVIESKHQLQGMPGRSSFISGELQAGGNSICLCLTGVHLWPPRMKPWAAWVHFHHTYSTDRHDLNHAWKLSLLL